MNVVLNGEPRELPEGLTVSEVVAVSGAEPAGRGVAVAVDGEVVPRADWDASLRAGQRIEVLKAVQGG